MINSVIKVVVINHSLLPRNARRASIYAAMRMVAGSRPVLIVV